MLDDEILVDEAFLDVLERGDVVHELEHGPLEDGPQTPGAGFALQGLLGHRHQGVVGEVHRDVVHLHELLELLHQGVLGLGEDLHQGVFIQLFQGGDHRQAPHELRDEPEFQQVLGLHPGQDFSQVALLFGLDLGAEAHGFLADAGADNVVQAVEGPPADEQDVGGVHLDELLLGVFAAALGGDARHGALDDLQQGLLHPFPGDVPGDGGAVALPGDLVHFVDIDDAPGGLLHVVVRRLEEVQDDVFHVLAHVARLGEGGGVGDGEGHVQDPGQGLRQQRFPGTGGADEQDVALLKLHAVQVHPAADALVMVVYRHRQDHFGPFLPDDVFVYLLFDAGWIRYGQPGLFGFFFFVFFGNNVVAELDALIADVDSGSGDELFHFALAFAAKRTQQVGTFVSTAFAHTVRPPQASGDFSGPGIGETLVDIISAPGTTCITAAAGWC